MKRKVDFHGGCIGCTEQEDKGLAHCVGCRYFECDWSLPDLRKDNTSEKCLRRAMKKWRREQRILNFYRFIAKSISFIKIKI
jgi:hypothetical protein